VGLQFRIGFTDVGHGSHRQAVFAGRPGKNKGKLPVAGDQSNFPARDRAAVIQV
jgi:hypothetical protein